MPRVYPAFFTLLLMLLTACSNTVRINVDSISDPSSIPPDKDYIMTSGMPEISHDDLYFREFSRYFQEILQEKGYTRVESRSEADLEVRLSYGISEGKNIYFTYDRPIYDFIGGDTIVYTTTRRGKDGKTVRTTETVHIPTRQALVGYATETSSRTVHTSFVILEAVSLSPGDEKKTLWKTTLRHTSEINDLRRLMPYFAAAARPYLGQDTGMARTVKLNPSDPAVMAIRP